MPWSTLYLHTTHINCWLASRTICTCRHLLSAIIVIIIIVIVGGQSVLRWIRNNFSIQPLAVNFRKLLHLPETVVCSVLKYCFYFACLFWTGMWFQSMDFKGYELANDSEDSVPIGSLDYLSTKYEVSREKLFVF